MVRKYWQEHRALGSSTWSRRSPELGQSATIPPLLVPTWGELRSGDFYHHSVHKSFRTSGSQPWPHKTISQGFQIYACPGPKLLERFHLNLAGGFAKAAQLPETCPAGGTDCQPGFPSVCDGDGMMSMCTRKSGGGGVRDNLSLFPCFTLALPGMQILMSLALSLRERRKISKFSNNL